MNVGGIMSGEHNKPESIEDAIHRVHASLNRSLANSRFIEIFYEIFMATDAEIRQMFAQTEFERQKKLLRKALLSAVTFAAGGEVARQRLALIRESHNRAHMNVRPELYPFWVSSLVQAVARCDPEYSPQLDQEWRIVLQPAVEFIISGYLE
jgi:hemoglobin-like flavoprotein